MYVQAVLNSDEGLSDRVVESFRIKARNRASECETFDKKSISFKGGGEVRFDISHRTVVLVDKRSPFLVRQRHGSPRAISSGPEVAVTIRSFRVPVAGTGHRREGHVRRNVFHPLEEKSACGACRGMVDGMREKVVGTIPVEPMNEPWAAQDCRKLCPSYIRGH